MAETPVSNVKKENDKNILVLSAGPGRKMFTEEDRNILGLSSTPGRKIFTEDERNLLLHLLKDYPLLESKSSDTATLQKKWRFWVELTNRFNAAAMNTKRTPEQLRKCWKNMKCKAKKNNQEVTVGETPHASLNFGNNSSPTVMNVDVDPVLINQSPEPVQNSWEGDLSTKNSQQPVTRSQTFDTEAAVPVAPSAVIAATVTPPSSQQTPEPPQPPQVNNIPNSVDFETAASSDSVWPVSLRPYQKRKLDAILDQDQKLTSSQLALSKLEEEKNKLQLKILNEQLKNVQKEAHLLDRKILLTDRKIQYWDRMFKTGGGHHHMFPNM